MKKLLQFCIILFIVVLPVQGNLFAKEESIKQDRLTYTIDETAQTASVTAADMDLTDVVIPEIITVEGATYPVTSIGESAFLKHKNLNSVHIPNTMKSIQRSAFSECSNLTTVNIPDGVAQLGDNTFYNCKKLTSLFIPNSVTEIGINAFLETTFETIVIPGSVKKIAGGLFMYSKITSITLSNHTSISASAFTGCLNNIKVLVMVDNINDPINKDITDALDDSSIYYRGVTNMEVNKTTFDVKQDSTLDFTPYMNITSKVYDSKNNPTDKMTVSSQYLQPDYTLDGAMGNTSMSGNTLYIDPQQSNDFSVKATLNGQTVTFAINVEKPVVVDPSITKVEIYQAPDQIAYLEGDIFDPAGLQLAVSYDDNTIKIITYSSSTKDDFAFTVNTPLTLSDTSVNIAYKEHSVEQKITVQRLPLIADPANNQINGLKAQYERGDQMKINVIGAGMDNTTPVKGDVRYQPIAWNIANEQTFDSINYDIVFDTKDLEKGTYQVTVTYQKEAFDGTIWNAEDTIQKTKQFEVLEAEVPVSEPDTPNDTPKDTPEDTPEDISKETPKDAPEDTSKETPEDAPKDTSKTPQTGDTTSTMSFLALILISSGAMLSLRKAKLKNK